MIRSGFVYVGFEREFHRVFAESIAASGQLDWLGQGIEHLRFDFALGRTFLGLDQLALLVDSELAEQEGLLEPRCENEF